MTAKTIRDNNINNFKWRTGWYHTGLLINVVGKAIKNEVKEQKVDFSMFSGTLGASLLGNP